MVITYYGAEFFKLQLGDTIIAVNPISKDSKLKPSKFGADICLVTANHSDFNGVDQVTFGDKKPFVVDGPGEYEIKTIFIRGFASHSSHGGKDLLNTIYVLTLDGMTMCFLGALDTKELSPEIIEDLPDIDILFVPIGGKGMLTPPDAYKLSVSLESKLIIPMYYAETDLKDALKTFLKEGGETVSPLDKLTIKKKDLEGKEGDIVVLAGAA